MNLDKILNLILAVVILVLAATVFTTKNHPKRESKMVETEKVNSGDIVYNNILTRSSVRSYTDQKISKDLLEKLVRAGMAAPTAMNKQPWKFIVVENRETLDKLATQLPNAKMLADAPAGIVVLGDLSKAENPPVSIVEYWIQDTSAATENILLAAHGFGLGAVWTGVYPNDARVKTIVDEFKLPENLVPLCLIAVGYPDGEPNIKDKWKEENVSWK